MPGWIKIPNPLFTWFILFFPNLYCLLNSNSFNCYLNFTKGISVLQISTGIINGYTDCSESDICKTGIGLLSSFR